MDEQRQEQSLPGRQQSASENGSYSDAGSGSNTSGLREKSVEEDIEPVERDLDTADRIEKLKEDADLDRVK